jgi:hypothetical protein
LSVQITINTIWRLLETGLSGGRLVRKTLTYSKAVICTMPLLFGMTFALPMQALRNLTHKHKSLRIKVFDDPTRRWIPRTPAMASGLTNHIWTVKELLTSIPLPSASNT